MPRVSRAQADRNRSTITQVSARLFRQRGIDGVSVADLMAAAGLTHGGFYGHFASKDMLAAEACGAAFEQSIQRWNERVAGAQNPAAARAVLIDGFLSATSCDQPGTSCPSAALAGDVARTPLTAPVRTVFGTGLGGLLEILESLQHSDGTPTDRHQALADLSTMVGALLLARATRGQPMSDDLLLAARSRLGG